MPDIRANTLLSQLEESRPLTTPRLSESNPLETRASQKLGLKISQTRELYVAFDNNNRMITHRGDDLLPAMVDREFATK